MLRYLDKSSGFLFSSRNLREMLEERSHAIRNEIEQVDSNQLLNTLNRPAFRGGQLV